MSGDASTMTPGAGSLRQRIRALVGEGDRIMMMTLPWATAGIVANVLWPTAFRTGPALAIVGIVLLTIGVPLWLTAALQLLAAVPKGLLITGGPFALVLHPVYTSVALLVIPGLGLLFGSWIGFAVGGVLYLASRKYSPNEERELAESFGAEYESYRRRVLLPWL